MRTYDKFYINGQWVEPIGKGTSEVINPATGEVSAFLFSASSAIFLKKPALSAAEVWDQEANAFMAWVASHRGVLLQGILSLSCQSRPTSSAARILTNAGHARVGACRQSHP